MNLLLQDPFCVLRDYPEKLTHTIRTPLQTACLQFSHRGEYLALGSLDGTVMIYDMDTFRPMAILGGESQGGLAHARAVQAIQWSNETDTAGGAPEFNSHFLLTASRDWKVKVWDIAHLNRPLREVPFTGPVWNCHWLNNMSRYHDGNNNNNHNNATGPSPCVVTVMEEEVAYLVHFKEGTSYDIIPLKSTNDNDTNNDDDDDDDTGFVLTSTQHPSLPNFVITGSSKGWIKMYQILRNDSNTSNAYTINLVYQEKICNANIKDIIVSQNSNKLAINCSDRTIRQFILDIDTDTMNVTISPEHRYQDVINRLQWNCIQFSNKSADYLIASTHGSSTHELYLFETITGSLVRVLEGAEEELMNIDWDFYNMSIASNGLETGDVYIWSLVIPPKWSALAPDFEEIEENIDYREKENEFDQFVLADSDQKESAAQSPLPHTGRDKIDLRTRETFDVRGNDLTFRQCPVPIDYQRIVAMNQQREHQTTNKPRA